jgi:hypothetical protein
MRRMWVLGFVLGALSGLIVLRFGTIGLAMPLASLALLRARPWLSPLSGLLVGLGLSVLSLLGLAASRCAGANQSGPGFASGCTPPDMTVLVGLATLCVVVGVIAGAIAVTRARTTFSLGSR